MFHNQDEHAIATYCSSWYARADCLGCSRQKKASANRLTWNTTLLFRIYIYGSVIRTKKDCHSKITRGWDLLLVYGAPLLEGQQHAPAGTLPLETVPRGPWAESRAEPGSYSPVLPVHQGTLLSATGIRHTSHPPEGSCEHISLTSAWRTMVRCSMKEKTLLYNK